MNWFKISQNFDLPKDFNSSQLGSCMKASEILTQQLLSQGISDFYVVEGWISFPNMDWDEGGEESSLLTHTWIEYQGKIIDPTKEQFKKWNFDPNKIEYVKIKRSYPPKEYLELCKRFPV